LGSLRGHGAAFHHVLLPRGQWLISRPLRRGGATHEGDGENDLDNAGIPHSSSFGIRLSNLR
jgi:hypothetical protein